MDYFTEVTDGKAITISGGVYRQVSVYRRADRLYARHGNGYVRLLQGGTTSAPAVRWLELDTPDIQSQEKFGGVFVQFPRIAAQ